MTIKNKRWEFVINLYFEKKTFMSSASNNSRQQHEYEEVRIKNIIAMKQVESMENSCWSNLNIFSPFEVIFIQQKYVFVGK
jgi:hypothetical protein